MHGTVYANNAVNEADLLLALGVRFDDRVTGKIERFAKHGTIVHIDIDNSEINKNKPVKLPILSDMKYALAPVERVLDNAGYERNREPATIAIPSGTRRSQSGRRSTLSPTRTPRTSSSRSTRSSCSTR